MLVLNSCCNNEISVCLNLLYPLIKYSNESIQNVSYHNIKHEYLTFIEWQSLYGDSSFPIKGRKAYIKSGFLPTLGFNIDVISIIIDAMINCTKFTQVCDSFITIETYSGTTATKLSNETAFYWRDNVDYLYQMKAIYTGNNNNIIDWANNVAKLLKPYVKNNGSAYVNYMDQYLDNWPYQYYGNNYNKLQCIKQLWDPHNFFNWKQSIKLPDTNQSCNFYAKSGDKNNEIVRWIIIIGFVVFVVLIIMLIGIYYKRRQHINTNKTQNELSTLKLVHLTESNSNSLFR